MNTIILNKLYVGNYLKKEKNIGHEVINLFKADNKKNYVYITPSGYLSKRYNDKITTVLLVREIKGNRVEIIAKATGLKQIAYKSNNLESIQRSYIKNQNITFGSVPLDRIMTEDKYNVRITFEAENIIKPNSPIYLEINDDAKKLSENNIYYLKKIKKIMPQSCRHYFSEGDINYKILESIINESSLWEKDNTTEIINLDGKPTSSLSFISLIRKEHDELTYSNMFSFFLSKNPILFCNFCKDILGILPSGEFSISREENNIDILIRDDNNFIIIENKIKSGINGIRHALKGEVFESQLSDYYNYAQKEAKGRKQSFFIFSPDYNKPELDELKNADSYKIVHYSELYNFFNNQMKNIREELQMYYEEFLKSLIIHTKKIDNTNYEIMYERFLNAIRKANKD